jgi:hypothetical protein
MRFLRLLSDRGLASCLWTPRRHAQESACELTMTRGEMVGLEIEIRRIFAAPSNTWSPKQKGSLERLPLALHSSSR